jgi:hypothetical protein
MATETTFFQNGRITVTNARFIVGAQTFAMRGITSVQSVETSPNYTGGFVMIVLGVIIAAAGFYSSSIGAGIFGLLVTAGGVWVVRQQKPTFAVVLRTSGGEVTAYQSEDRSHIAQIILALNDSIISHG